MPDIKVCTANWTAVHGSTFKWHNVSQQDAASVTQITGSNWPFTSPSPINLNPGEKLDCGLIQAPGTYQYNSNPCSTLGNPKTVIIS